MHAAAMVAFAFFAVAIVLSGIRPLWVDEILQLMDTRQPSLHAMFLRIPRNAGGVPLAYLIQHLWLELSGYSELLARLPSAVCGAGAVFIVALLGAETGLRRPWLAAAIFGVLPLTLRYATESRGYAQALFFSVFATLLYVRLPVQPSRWRMVAYWLALTAAIYSQPYSVSVGLAHVLWSLSLRDRVSARRGVACLFLAGFAFLPWYAWSRAGWVASVRDSDFHFVFTAHTPLLIFRELAGAGYWGSALLVVLCGAAALHRLPTRPAARLLELLIVVPIAFALAADGWSGYFVAVRQFLWVLPAVAILAAAVVERGGRSVSTVAALLAAVCLWQSVRFFTAPREDWQAAANVLAEHTARGACLVVAPLDHGAFYEYFHPELRSPACSGSRVVLAISPYAKPAESQAPAASLIREGYTRGQETEVGKSRIVEFRRQE